MRKSRLTFLGGLVLLVVIYAVSASSGISTDNSMPESNKDTAYFFTADEGGSITKVDAEKNTVVGIIKDNGIFHNVQVSPDGKILGAVFIPSMEGSIIDDGHGKHSEMKMNGYALFFDTSTNKLIKKVEVGSHPAHIVFTSEGKYALVTNSEDNNVSVIDTSVYEVKNLITTGKGPHGFRISTDSRFAFVANMGEDTVSILDIEGGVEVKKIKVGQTPVTTGITNDGKTMVATLNAENALAIVDLATGQLDKVDVGTGPAQVYIGSDDRFAFVANQGTEKQPSNTLSKIDLSAKKVVATIQTGNGAHGVVVSNDNNKVYVTNMFDNTVSVVDNTLDQVVSTVKVGNTPNGISYLE